MISASELREIIDYNPYTGDFVWRKKFCDKVVVGRKAGSRCKEYLEICIKGHRDKAHRWAWLYMTGAMPTHDIDHADTNPINNKWANLREATESQNIANSVLSKINSSGYKGVSRCGNKWKAQITKNYKNIYLGLFDSPLDAHRAYCDAAEKLFGEYARAA